jgi:general secretion pathway protein I
MLKKKGFTLIEVLIALAIISIALTALLRTTAETVKSTHYLRQKTLARFVTTQGLTLVQLDLVPLKNNQTTTQAIKLFDTQWFWQAHKTPTDLKQVDRIEVTASMHENGPFTEPLIGFTRLES